MRLIIFRKALAEFIGTFAIVFGGCGAIAVNQITNGTLSHLGIAIVFGATVMTMIYAVGHVSGAHFNPAVTIAFAITRHFPKKEILPFITAQCAGATLASFLHLVILQPILQQYAMNVPLDFGVTKPIIDSIGLIFVFEFILTFFLMFVIISVATDTCAVGELAGIAIGGTVMFEAMFAGPICGASMNPARSLGPALVSGNWHNYVAYLVGPVLGAIAGALVYQFIRKVQCCKREDDKQQKIYISARQKLN
jgi:MIP family channel proteins